VTALIRAATLVVAVFAAVLPYRLWQYLPAFLEIESAAFLSGIGTLFIAAAVGIPGFLSHAAQAASLANETMIKAEMHRITDYNSGKAMGFSGLSIFTFMVTPVGLVTMYLAGSGTARAIAAWFDDPMGDPILTGIDALFFGAWRRSQAGVARTTRRILEGPDTADRVVSGSAAGIPDCDVVVVATRRKPGWDRGVVVITEAGCYRIGNPVERTIAGRLRTLYPLSEHRDLEVIRKSVHYDLPHPPDAPHDR
jgi:hypothetical protein